MTPLFTAAFFFPNLLLPTRGMFVTPSGPMDGLRVDSGSSSLAGVRGLVEGAPRARGPFVGSLFRPRGPAEAIMWRGTTSPPPPPPASPVNLPRPCCSSLLASYLAGSSAPPRGQGKVWTQLAPVVRWAGQLRLPVIVPLPSPPTH